MKIRTISIDLDTAKKWYEGNDSTLKGLAINVSSYSTSVHVSVVYPTLVYFKKLKRCRGSYTPYGGGY